MHISYKFKARLNSWGSSWSLACISHFEWNLIIVICQLRVNTQWFDLNWRFNRFFLPFVHNALNNFTLQTCNTIDDNVAARSLRYTPYLALQIHSTHICLCSHHVFSFFQLNFASFYGRRRRTQHGWANGSIIQTNHKLHYRYTEIYMSAHRENISMPDDYIIAATYLTDERSNCGDYLTVTTNRMWCNNSVLW